MIIKKELDDVKYIEKDFDELLSNVHILFSKIDMDDLMIYDRNIANRIEITEAEKDFEKNFGEMERNKLREIVKVNDKVVVRF